MPETIAIGTTGSTVILLQAQLNLLLPQLAPLDVDGIFGPLTNSNVLYFQRINNLKVDGIVGPKTWAALLVPNPMPPNPQGTRRCGNGYPGNQAIAQCIIASLGGGAFSRSSQPGFALVSASVGGGAAAAGSGISLKPLAGAPEEATARGVYGASLDYSRIFMSNVTGLQNRPFTLAMEVTLNTAPFIPGPPPIGTFVQILNLGTFSPPTDDLIHELGHAWQSQHHTMPMEFIANCAACLAEATRRNLRFAATHPSVILRPDFPTDFPFSAYGTIAGSPFADYAGEQIARQIEIGDASIRSHVKGVSAGAVDTDNVKSVALTHIKVQDLRAPGARP